MLCRDYVCVFVRDSLALMYRGPPTPRPLLAHSWPTYLLHRTIEGHELPVLRGLGRLLGAPPYPLLQMEFEPPLQRGAGFEPSA